MCLMCLSIEISRFQPNLMCTFSLSLSLFQPLSLSSLFPNMSVTSQMSSSSICEASNVERRPEIEEYEI